MGGELTTEAYAEAMEAIAAAREEKIEAAAEGVLFGALFSADTVERLDSLETSESWSDEDAEFASDVAETMLRALTGLYGDLLRITRDSFDEISSLQPPEHLSDLHGDYVATSREVLQHVQEFVDRVQDTDTTVENQEQLASFYEAVNSLEFGPSNAENLEERAERACLELEGQLAAELERGVSICDAEPADATSTGPALEPAPAESSPTETPTAPAQGTTKASTEEFISVSAGSYHTCGVRADGSVVCWGYDYTCQDVARGGVVCVGARDKPPPPAGEFLS
ncbi:MAG: RCC1 domain-containing protein, partial [Chloroflexi bacterium]|nr:RCC1 domain-containing protein [Chloroflexota bacterium]